MTHGSALSSAWFRVWVFKFRVVPRRLLLVAIRFYQRYLSFDTGVLKFLFLTGPSTSPSTLSSGPTGSGRASLACRFSPRCSDYTYQAVERYGIIWGLWLGVKRIIRCHPWSKGGSDPVPQKQDLHR